MAKSVTVMQRIKVGRTYPLIRVVFSRNGKPKIDPRATSFYLRYTLDGKRKCDAIGSDIDAVLARKIEIESKLRTGASVGINPTLVAPNLTTLAGAANQYFENLAARGLDIKTIHTYRVAVCDFLKSCSKIFVEDINKQDLFNYMAWLRKQPPTPRKDGTPRKRRKSGDPGTHGRAERALSDAVSEIISHPVLRDWMKDPSTPKSFRDAGHFWGIAPGTPPRVIRSRIQDVNRTLVGSGAETRLTLCGKQ